ncbi:hypothetical protein BJX70DRAFT_101614 [Aspergillus crustosus]
MDPSFVTLPTELLLEIFSYLPTITQYSFSYVNQRLRLGFAPICRSISIETRWHIRDLLARDGVPFQDYAYCSGCSTSHRLKYFTPDQLEQPPKRRLCLTSKTQLWVAPGQFLSFQDVSRQRKSWHWPYPDDLPALNQILIMRLFSAENVWRYTEYRRSIWRDIPEQFVVCASYEILSMPNSKSVSGVEVERILQGFDIPTCPHNKLGNGDVAASYRESSHCTPETDEKKKIWIGQLQTDSADAWCKFPGCKTLFRWECRPSLKRDNWKTLVLVMKRYLGGLLSPVNPRWMAQLVGISDEARLQAFWDGCHQWRDVNMAIEEKRYELELKRGRKLTEKEESEFEQLRRENDYLRHPNPHKLPGPLDINSLVRVRDGGLSLNEELPPTAALLLEAQNEHDPASADTETQQGAYPTAVDNTPQNLPNPSITKATTPLPLTPITYIPSAKRNTPLYRPVHSESAILATIDNEAHFTSLYADIRALTPLQRNIEKFLWGAGDCTSMEGGVFGILGKLTTPMIWPSRRWGG